jgi:uncharacterized damage-inducible protein DinB
MNSITEITKLLSLNTRLFRNVLEGISETESLKRISEKTNHLRWIAGHLTGLRYRNLERMGLKPAPFEYMEKYFIPDAPPPGNRPWGPGIEYPELKELLQRWNEYSAPWIEAVRGLTAEQLAIALPFQLPIEGGTLLDSYAFYASHEIYHIGQMSIIRRVLGHDAMSFI